MMERMTFLFTGIMADSVRYELNLDPGVNNFNNFPKEIQFLFRRFRLIIDFICCVIRNDVPDDNISGFLGMDSIYSSKNHSDLHEISPYLKNKSLTLNNNQLNSPYKRKHSVNSFSTHNKNLEFQKALEGPDEKEQCMAFIYGFLDQYFKTKSSNKKTSQTIAGDSFQLAEDSQIRLKNEIGGGFLNDSLNSSPNLPTIKSLYPLTVKQGKENDLLEAIEKFRSILSKETVSSKGKSSEKLKINSDTSIYPLKIMSSDNEENDFQFETKLKKSKKNLPILTKLASIQEEDKKDNYSEEGFTSKKSLPFILNLGTKTSNKELDLNPNIHNLKVFRENSNYSTNNPKADKSTNLGFKASEIYSHELFNSITKKTAKAQTAGIFNTEINEKKSRFFPSGGRKVDIPLHLEEKNGSPIGIKGQDLAKSSNQVFSYNNETIFQHIRKGRNTNEDSGTLKAKKRVITSVEASQDLDNPGKFCL